ncbi:MAG: lipopolysaccharide heptosyltransferase II [Candidatus Omnitrophota bacterium]|nr:lipopolysaccharide heptosyltransferase II [Candidatus Omnitrophota bacterium]MDZ4242521.1 lipopolysaccharide heptosyltransferase II [Candidatus Omnitrophota bacterium]
MPHPILQKKRFLIINPYGIGDVLFTTPLIRNIKNNIPEALIGYVANRRTAEILQNHPAVNRVFIYDRDEFARLSHESKRLLIGRAREFLSEIRKERFEVVFDLSLNSSMNFLSWLAGIPIRAGYDYKGRSRFLTHRVPLSGYEGRPVAEYYLDLLRTTGMNVRASGLELFLKPEDEQWAENFFRSSGINRKKNVIGIVPGGGASWGREAAYKRWPAEKFASLTERVVRETGSQIIFFGEQREEELCRDVARASGQPAVMACGRTTVSQCAAMFKRCSLVVANDGGPVHIAVASGVKTVSIFGPVDDRVYGPYPRERHAVAVKDIACRPCYRQFRRAECSHVSCLSRLDVEGVFAKVREALTS